MSAAILAQYAMDAGIPLDGCLRETGLSLAMLANPSLEIAGSQELTLIANLTKALDPGRTHGLEVGPRYHLTTYGIWGFALLSCRDVRSAVALGMSSVELTFAFTSTRIEVGSPDACFMFEDAHLAPEIRAFIVDRDASALATLQREIVSVGLPASRITLRRSAPSDTSLYEEIWGVVPTFDAPENRFFFDARVLDFPLPQANEDLARECEAQCRALLERRRSRSGFSSEVRDRLLSGMREMADMDAMARVLGMTSRTLRRRLEDEGTSFSELVDEVRLMLAEDLLRAQNHTVAEVAERLGYSEVSNFIRAFKRLTGVTPSAFRNRVA